MEQETDISKIGNVRFYRLGTRLVTSCGGRFQYGKIDFGIVGKVDGKAVKISIFQ